MRYGKYKIERRPRKCPGIDEKLLTEIGLTKHDIDALRVSEAGRALLKSYLATNKEDRANVAGKRGL